MFRGRTLEGVMSVREEDLGMYRSAKRQKQGVELDTNLTDRVELREDQAERLHTSIQNIAVFSG